MKGLIISDWLYLKKRLFDLKSNLLNIAVCLIGILFGKHIGGILINGYLCLLLTTTPVFLSSKKLVKRSITYPISMNQIVGSRFLAVFLTNFIYIVAAGILNFVDFFIKGYSAANYFYSFTAFTLIGLTLMAICIFFNYTGHMMFQLVIMIFALLAMMLPLLIDIPVLSIVQAFLNLTVVAKFLILSASMIVILSTLYELSVLILKHQAKDNFILSGKGITR